MTHETCTVTRTEHVETHECPPCPHGLLRGFEMPLTGSDSNDHKGRLLRLQSLDSLTCDGIDHVLALATSQPSQ